MIRNGNKIKIEIIPRKLLEPLIRICCNGSVFIEGKVRHQGEWQLIIKAKNGKECYLTTERKEFKRNIARIGLVLNGTVFDVNDKQKIIEFITDNADRYYIVA